VKVLVLVAVPLLLAACSSGSTSSSRADRCVERMLTRATVHGNRSEVKAYLRGTYCDRFAANGWVYADGALSIDAQNWLVHGYTCERSQTGQRTRTVPCDDINGESATIECGMLHFVRRAEVREYLLHVKATHCDDGTPFAELGA
jgi:hypothetical protein